jgi:hypothetical protein
MSSTYEGWANFETWCVDQAMTGDPQNGRYWRSVARWHAREAKARHPGRETCREARHHARVRLGREISQGLYDNRPMPTSDLYADLLSAALDNVDYAAIAERLLDEFFEAGDGTSACSPGPATGG